MANAWAIDKPWTYMEVEHAQGPCTTNLYSANTGVVGHGSKARAYSGVPAQTLLGEMSY